MRPHLPAMDEFKQLPLALMLSGVLAISYFLPNGHDDQRALELALLLLFCLIGLVKVCRGGAVPLFPVRSNPFLAAFFLLGIWSSARAFSPAHAFYEVSSFVILLMLGLCVARELSRSAGGLLYVLKICGYGCVLYALKIMIVYMAALVGGFQPEVLDFSPGFSNYRFLNHAQTVTLPLLVLLLMLDRPAGKARPLWCVLAGFWWTLLIVLTGRGTLMGLIAGTVLAYAVRQRHAHAFCRALWLTALLGAAIYAVFFYAIPKACGMEPFGELFNLVQRTVENPTSSRKELWLRALDLISTHPWLGAGPLHYAHDAGVLHTYAHPHNWVLQIGAEWGLPALLCLCLALGTVLLRLLRTARWLAPDDANQHTILTAWIVTGAALLVDGLFSGLIVMPVSQLLIALYLGCAVGWAWSLKGAPAADSGPGWPRAAQAALLLTAMLLLVNGAWPGLKGKIGLHVPPAPKEEPYRNSYYPRLWRFGYF